LVRECIKPETLDKFCKKEGIDMYMYNGANHKSVRMRKQNQKARNFVSILEMIK
jgi:hypothetical protein